MQHGIHLTTVSSHCKPFLLHCNILEALPKLACLDLSATLAWSRDLVSTISCNTDAANARDVLGLLGDNYPGCGTNWDWQCWNAILHWIPPPAAPQDAYRSGWSEYEGTSPFPPRQNKCRLHKSTQGAVIKDGLDETAHIASSVGDQ